MAREVEVPQSVQADGGGSGVHRPRGPRNDPATCGGFRPPEARTGEAGEGRTADSHAGTSRLQGDARLGDVLPRLYGEVVAREAWRSAYGRTEGEGRRLPDGMDSAADGMILQGVTLDPNGGVRVVRLCEIMV